MYQAKEDRYVQMNYLRCGKSGILLPRVALGLWHNFGSVDCFENMKDMLFEAFDRGITHFDLANNYGPVYGSAEEKFKHSWLPSLRHPLSPLRAMWDPYWLEKKNMDERPYPLTGKLFSEGTA